MANIFQPAPALLLCSAQTVKAEICGTAMESENKLLNESTEMCKMHKKLQCSFRGHLHVNSSPNMPSLLSSFPKSITF